MANIDTQQLKEHADALVARSMSRYWLLVKRVFVRFSEAAYKLMGYQTTYLQKEDQQRLLLLWHMIEKTGLTFEEGLGVLFEYWSEKGSASRYVVHGKNRLDRLPIRIWNLLGPVSQKVLADYAAKTYPGNEHKHIQRQELRQELLDQREEVVERIKYYDSRQLSREYEERITNARKRFQNSNQFQKHTWRGNPWL